MNKYAAAGRPAKDLPSIPIRQSLRHKGQPLRLKRGAVIYAQGEPGGRLFLVERGRVKLTSVSLDGRQATIALVWSGMFFGESCLASNMRRHETACALTDCNLVCLEKSDMEPLLACDHELAASFIRFLLDRNRCYEDDRLDQLFNSSERRLARALLLLAYSNRDSHRVRTITGISHETLAELIGTTRARVSSFMTGFRKKGWIDYNRREIHVHPSLRDRLLKPEPPSGPSL